MRFDRVLTLGVASPVRGLLTQFSARGEGIGDLPILMYHSVSDTDEGDRSAYYRTSTSPEAFRAQMHFLRENGWKGLSLREARGATEDRTVAITFDDGFRDFYEIAAPILQECGFTATVYLPTSFVADREPRRHFGGHECLLWREVIELQGRGLEFGSHTRTHPDLTQLSLLEMEAELRDARMAIEQRLQAPVTAFAYPFAFPQSAPAFCARVRGALMRCGYTTCVTTQVGRASAGTDPLRLPRLPVNGADDLALFSAKLNGHYDWVGLPQLAYKRIKRVLTAPRRPVLVPNAP